MLIRKLIFLTSGLLLFFNPLIGQNSEAEKVFIEAQRIYGSNDFLERGLIYIPEHPKANGHPYFKNPDWIESSITFLGETYPKLHMKYNLTDEAIILQKTNEGSNVKQPILLNSNQIDAFSIYGHTFSNLNYLDSSYALGGFGEIIYTGNILFIQKYSKSFLNNYNKSNPYGLYSKMIVNHYLLMNGRKYRITGKRSLLRAFHDIQKPLKKKLREINFHFKKATNQQWFEIIKWCDEQIEK